jgi:hypothetical protein
MSHAIVMIGVTSFAWAASNPEQIEDRLTWWVVSALAAWAVL